MFLILLALAAVKIAHLMLAWAIAAATEGSRTPTPTWSLTVSTMQAAAGAVVAGKLAVTFTGTPVTDTGYTLVNNPSLKEGA